MNDNKTGLENFVERHRADFDAFEPRPDLWDDLEAQLSAPAAAAASAETEPLEPAPLRLVKLYPTADPASPVASGRRWPWLPRPGIAASIGLLVLAGAGAIWSNQHTTATTWTATGVSPRLFALSDPDAGLAAENLPYFGASTVAAATSQPGQRLETSVQRMEEYYAAQINERRRELEQLETATAQADASADWQRELAALDSTYRQLKQELYRHPEPDVVLAAMDRNLQIRLDILSQQARTREQMQDYHTRPQMVAESHPQP